MKDLFMPVDISAVPSYIRRRLPGEDIWGLRSLAARIEEKTDISALASGTVSVGALPTVVMAGADNTGVIDASSAFATRLAENRRFRVPKGTYKWSSLPSMSGVTKIDIEGDGEDETIIELAAGAATKSIPTGALGLLRAKGVQFKGFDTVFKITGGFGKTKFTPIDITATSPYTSFTDANFRPTELDFAGRVRMVTTDATLVYAVQMTLADGKSIAGFVKARGVQTSGTPSGSTILTHEQRNTGYQSAGTLTMGTATVTQAPSAGISGWASAFNATSANVRIGVDGVAATTIEWWLEWDIWCK